MGSGDDDDEGDGGERTDNKFQTASLSLFPTVGSLSPPALGDLAVQVQIPGALGDEGALSRLVADRYELGEEVGQGGTSRVFQAVDRHLSRSAALKVLARECQGQLSETFRDEGCLTAMLEHPGVIPVHDMGVDDQGQPFLAMKLVRGVTLSERIHALGDNRLEPDSLTSLVEVLERVCDVLSYAHSQGVVHCDLKPDNIMLGEFGEVYLMDWGIARRTAGPDAADAEDDDEAGHTLVGTPGFMAPEQACNDEGSVGPSTDIFGLGGVLYHALTGQPPFRAPTLMAMIYQTTLCEPTPPEELLSDQNVEVPPALSRIAMRALSRRPEDRYADALEFKAELQRSLRVNAAVSTRMLCAGEVVFREGDVGETAYIIRRGKCVAFTERDGGRRDVAVFKPGDIFGEMAVISGEPRSLSVATLTEVTLWEISSETLAELTGLDSWAGIFLRTVVSRLRKTQDALLESQAGRPGGQGASARRE